MSRKEEHRLRRLVASITPTRDGFETAISFVGQNQGIFLSSGAGFANNVGTALALADLKP